MQGRIRILWLHRYQLSALFELCLRCVTQGADKQIGFFRNVVIANNMRERFEKLSFQLT